VPWRTFRCALTGAIVACVPPDPPSAGSATTRTGTLLAGTPGAAGASAFSDAGTMAVTSTKSPWPTPSGSGSNREAIAEDPPLTATFRDSFSRDALGEDYRPTSPHWRVRDGQLCGRGARNHPVWLRRRLPRNARVEFTAVSRSPEGDIKVEAWGDGAKHATSSSYRDATSYLIIFGGWQNRLHVLARLDEHGADRIAVEVEPTAGSPGRSPVIPGRAYRFRIERTDGRTLRWSVDDVEVASFADSAPLTGAEHDHFAFNDWDAEVCFDDLVITPL